MDTIHHLSYVWAFHTRRALITSSLDISKEKYRSKEIIIQVISILISSSIKVSSWKKIYQLKIKGVALSPGIDCIALHRSCAVYRARRN